MLRLRRLFQQRREKRRLSACKAHAVSGTPAAFRAGAAKPRLFLRFGEAETQGVRTAARVAEVGESAVGGLNFCDRGGVSRGVEGRTEQTKAAVVPISHPAAFKPFAIFLTAVNAAVRTQHIRLCARR